MGLRKEKAARIKLSVLDQTLRLIGKKPFQDLYVEEICGKVKISKVTLFKYFPQKEDILLYYLRVWCYRRAVELRDKPKAGMAGVMYLSDKLCDDAENYPGLLLSLLGYLSDLKRPPKPFPLKAEEKILLYPLILDAASIEIHSLEQMIESFVLEAIFKKEITRTTSTKEITNLITSIVYGSLATAHITQQSALRIFFRRNIDLALKGLQ